MSNPINMSSLNTPFMNKMVDERDLQKNLANVPRKTTSDTKSTYSLRSNRSNRSNRQNRSNRRHEHEYEWQNRENHHWIQEYDHTRVYNLLRTPYWWGINSDYLNSLDLYPYMSYVRDNNLLPPIDWWRNPDVPLVSQRFRSLFPELRVPRGSYIVPRSELAIQRTAQANRNGDGRQMLYEGFSNESSDASWNGIWLLIILVIIILAILYYRKDVKL